jgi:hypothetical protein
MVIEFYDPEQDETVGFICSLSSKTLNTPEGTVFSYVSYECFEIRRYDKLLKEAKEFFVNKTKHIIKELKVLEDKEFCFINIAVENKDD